MGKLMLIPKQNIVRDEKHRRFIASLPCVICDSTDTQAAHIRKGNGGGMGLKPCDRYCIPLCCVHHREQGDIGELKFYYPHGGYERAAVLAKKLYEFTGNDAKAEQLIKEWRWTR